MNVKEKIRELGIRFGLIKPTPVIKEITVVIGIDKCQSQKRKTCNRKGCLKCKKTN